MIYMTVGVFLVSATVVVLVALMVSRPSHSSASLLAPVLAIDTLDEDLKILYARTLLIDAECAQEFGSVQLGAEIRRYLLDLQAARVQQTPGCDRDLAEITEIAHLDPQSSLRTLESQKLSVRRIRERIQENGVTSAL